jgi:hypothetical protein
MDIIVTNGFECPDEPISGWTVDLLDKRYLNYFHQLIGCRPNELLYAGWISYIENSILIQRTPLYRTHIENCVYKTLVHFNDKNLEFLKSTRLLFDLSK